MQSEGLRVTFYGIISSVVLSKHYFGATEILRTLTENVSLPTQFWGHHVYIVCGWPIVAIVVFELAIPTISDCQ